jgi:cardiolipin-specific phospholipase
LVHGYGASGIIFFKIMKPLVEAGFNLIFVDILGMGASGRPTFREDQSPSEADEFFISFLERWRIAMGDLKNFYLAGHSFGGYICGHYALRYPHHIKKLLMLSPAGVMTKPANFDEQAERRRGIFFKLVTTAWEKKWSPFGILRKSGSWIGRSLIKKYVNRRMGASLADDAERATLLEYFHQTFLREGSTEYAIFICFQLGLYAHHPLEVAERLGGL